MWIHIFWYKTVDSVATLFKWVTVNCYSHSLIAANSDWTTLWTESKLKNHWSAFLFWLQRTAFPFMSSSVKLLNVHSTDPFEVTYFTYFSSTCLFSVYSLNFWIILNSFVSNKIYIFFCLKRSLHASCLAVGSCNYSALFEKSPALVLTKAFMCLNWNRYLFFKFMLCGLCLTIAHRTLNLAQRQASFGCPVGQTFELKCYWYPNSPSSSSLTWL